jgi:hypothetical protein
MKKLTADNVAAVMEACLFTEAENHTDAVEVDGITHKVSFHPGRLEAHRQDIAELLSQLPDEFQAGKGGGMSFLNACMTKDGDQWGEHMNMEQLMLLGMATKQVLYLMPRDLWSALPGGMPYFVVLEPKVAIAPETTSPPVPEPARTPNLDYLREEVTKLKELLDDPQPGHMAWCGFYNERMTNISNFWLGKDQAK